LLLKELVTKVVTQGIAQRIGDKGCVQRIDVTQGIGDKGCVQRIGDMGCSEW
jgi:hypothetical protein